MGLVLNLSVFLAILGLALIESLVIYALIIALLLVLKVG